MEGTAATITVGKVAIETYTWDKPGRYPGFLVQPGWKGCLYPYTTQDRLLHKRKAVEYEQITLENDYIRVTVLPGLGGHLWSAYDKVSGKEMFYNNHVVKPGLVALRGAWWASGIEWNFPKGHSVSTVSPVDFTTRQNADGSVTAVVGDVDRITRMRWTVKITVHPGRTGFSLETILSNTDAYPHRYMYWENCAIHTTDGFQFISPAKSAWTWGGQKPFPVYRGVDQSWYKEQRRAVDFFTLGVGQDYFGYYDHQRLFGAVHIADNRKMPGKKFFTWGTAEHAKVWEKNLTDTDGPYIELQCGLSYTQAMYDFFDPLTAKAWDEVWYPVGALGYFVYANRSAALHFSNSLQQTPWPPRLDVGIVTVERHPNANVRITSDGKELVSQEGVRFRVGVPKRWKVELPEGTKEIAVEVKSGGKTILRYSTAYWKKIKDIDLKTLASKMRAKMTGSAKSYVAAAAQAVTQGDLGKALELSGRALEKNRRLGSAHYWKGSTLFIIGKYREARKHLRAISPRSKHWRQAQVLLGEMARFAGRTQEVLKIAGKLVAKEGDAAPGNILAGKALLAAGDAAGAAGRLAAAARSKGASPHTVALYAAALRRAGKIKRALRQARRAVEMDPLDFLGLNELALAGGESPKDEVMRGVEESFIELAAYYEDAGLFDEAAAILEDFRKTVVENGCGALVYYHLGYVNRNLSREAESLAFFRKAAGSQPDNVFASRREDVLALRAALDADESDALAHYLLGTYLAWRFRYDEALAHWKKALKGLGNYPVLLRNIALYHQAVSGNYSLSAKYYLRAIEAAPTDEELYAEADTVYGKSGALKARVRLLERGDRDLPGSQKVHKLLAQSYYFADRWDDAIDCLMSRNYDHWENDRLVYHIYQRSYLEKGRALLKKRQFVAALDAFSNTMKFPANLKIGKPAFPRNAPGLYLSGIAYQALGEKEKALGCWRQGADEEHHGWDGGICEEGYYKALCLEKVGRTREARAHLRRLTRGAARKFQGGAYDEFIKGLGYQGLEMWDKAIEHFEASMAGDRTNRNVRDHLVLAKKHKQAGL